MAGIKISALPAVATALLTDFYPVVQAGVTSQETNQQLLTLFNANIQLAAAAQVTGLGQSGIKNVTDNSKTIVASVNSTFTIGHILTASDTAGTITDSGVTIAAIAGLTWVDEGVSVVGMLPNQGYIIDDGASLVTLTLPAVCAQGVEMSIAGKSSGGWLIAQNASQIIHFGNAPTSVGAGGSLASTNQYDCVNLLCITANTTFLVLNAVGSLTVV